MIGLKKEIFFQVALENSIVSSKALYQNSIVKRTIDGENCVRKRVLMGGERERELGLQFLRGKGEYQWF